MADAFVPDMSVMADQWGQRGPSRQLTAVAVEGELGASYTVYATNWKCGECKAENYPRRSRCHRCRAPKAKVAEAQASSHIINGRHNPWREVYDAESKSLYYFNVETNATSWERPEAMGPAPHATGWFGRGAAGSGAASQYDAANAEYLKRPARKQADSRMAATSVAEGGGEYNIWYNRYLGDYERGGRGKALAEARCVVATDAGYTKADKHGNNAKYFCLFFARGNCAYGPGCQFAHRVPVRADHTRLLQDELHDCFGRDRHKDHREDMDGVGSVLKPCRTLFVGSITKDAKKYATPQALEAALWKAFGEWGEVENVNLIARLSIAFVRYRYRCGAELGKEAMANQHLEHDEVLNVRWAYDDPNPVALEAAQRADADAVVNMLVHRGVALAPGQQPPPPRPPQPAVAAHAAHALPSTSAAGGEGAGGGGAAAAPGVQSLLPQHRAPGAPGSAAAAEAAEAAAEAAAAAAAAGPEAAAKAAAEAAAAAAATPVDEFGFPVAHSGAGAATTTTYAEVSSMRPDDYALPPAKRLRVNGQGEREEGEGEGGMGAAEAAHLDASAAAAGIVWYPDTDAQYTPANPQPPDPQAGAAAAAAAAAGAAAGAAAAAAAAAAATGSAPAPVAAAAAALATAPAAAADDVFWRPAKDPTTGATYFYNTQSGKTSWAPPAHAMHASAAKAAADAAALAAAHRQPQ